MSNALSEATTVKIQDILLQQLGVERSQVTPDAAIMADLGADSLDVVEIGMTVEETFNLTIPDEDMETVRTVGDLHEVLARFLEQTGQPV